MTEPIAGTGSVGDYDCKGFYGTTCRRPGAGVAPHRPCDLGQRRGTWTCRSPGAHFDEVDLDTSSREPLLAGDPATADARASTRRTTSTSRARGRSWRPTRCVSASTTCSTRTRRSAARSVPGAGNGNTYPAGVRRARPLRVHGPDGEVLTSSTTTAGCRAGRGAALHRRRRVARPAVFVAASVSRVAARACRSPAVRRAVCCAAPIAASAAPHRARRPRPASRATAAATT